MASLRDLMNRLARIEAKANASQDTDADREVDAWLRARTTFELVQLLATTSDEEGCVQTTLGEEARSLVCKALERRKDGES